MDERDTAAFEVIKQPVSNHVGRSGARRRGQWLVPAVIVGVGVATAVTLPPMLDDASQHTATTPEFRSYNAADMRERLISAAASVLGKSIPDPAHPRFTAGTNEFRELAAADYADAEYMNVLFGDKAKRSVQLYSGHATDAATLESGPSGYCWGLEEGTQVSCEIEELDSGAYLISTVTPLLRAEDLGADKFKMVDYRTLTPDDLADVDVERAVRVIHPGGYDIMVTERVAAPTSLTDAAFSVPTDAMEDLATDTSLAIPYPGE